MRAAVVVVVPARDEDRRIGACLRAVRTSLAVAARSGAIVRSHVVVVAHRCSDRTGALARAALAGTPHQVAEDGASVTVGEVRRLGVELALAAIGPAGHTWVLSTDADSVVPPSWVSDVLAHAVHGSAAVVGMTTLRRGWGSPTARAAYRQIIASGLRDRGHDHVYGANLAVRADAYAAVGGFRAVRVGEDRALVDALVRYGVPVTRPRDLVVATSARRTGRATGGLADLLADLDDRTHSTDGAEGVARGPGCRLAAAAPPSAASVGHGAQRRR